MIFLKVVKCCVLKMLMASAIYMVPSFQCVASRDFFRIKSGAIG